MRCEIAADRWVAVAAGRYFGEGYAEQVHRWREGNGRPPIGLEHMLRMYFLQHWFNLADEACEESLLDNTALRRFGH
jgi:hypothetical protein